MMLWLIGSILVVLGLYVFLMRRSLSSWMIASQLVFPGVATLFYAGSLYRGELEESQLGAMYVIILGTIFTGVLLGLSIRRFYLTRGVQVDPGETVDE